MWRMWFKRKTLKTSERCFFNKLLHNLVCLIKKQHTKSKKSMFAIKENIQNLKKVCLLYNYINELQVQIYWL